MSPNEYSPLVLAYLGDAVFELYVRKTLIGHGNTQVEKRHPQGDRHCKL